MSSYSSAFVILRPVVASILFLTAAVLASMSAARFAADALFLAITACAAAFLSRTSCAALSIAILSFAALIAFSAAFSASFADFTFVVPNFSNASSASFDLIFI